MLLNDRKTHTLGSNLYCQCNDCWNCLYKKKHNKKRVFDETSDSGFIKIYTKIKEEKRRLGLKIQRFLIRIDPLLSPAPFGTVAHSDKIYRTSHRNELEISVNGRILSEMLIEYWLDFVLKRAGMLEWIEVEEHFISHFSINKLLNYAITCKLWQQQIRMEANTSHNEKFKRI